MDKSPDAFRTISEVSEWLETPAHVLRFWETRFTQLKPVKRAGGRRYYRPADMALLGGIKKLLHDEGMTIRGVQKILREQGVRHVAGLGADLVDQPFGTAPLDLDSGWQDEAPMQVDAEDVVEDRPGAESNIVRFGGTSVPSDPGPADADAAPALAAAPVDLILSSTPPSSAPLLEDDAVEPLLGPHTESEDPFATPPGDEEEWAELLAQEAAARLERDRWPGAALDASAPVSFVELETAPEMSEPDRFGSATIEASADHTQSDPIADGAPYLGMDLAEQVSDSTPDLIQTEIASTCPPKYPNLRRSLPTPRPKTLLKQTSPSLIQTPSLQRPNQIGPGKQ